MVERAGLVSSPAPSAMTSRQGSAGEGISNTASLFAVLLALFARPSQAPQLVALTAGHLGAESPAGNSTPAKHDDASVSSHMPQGQHAASLAALAGLFPLTLPATSPSAEPPPASDVASQDMLNASATVVAHANNSAALASATAPLATAAPLPQIQEPAEIASTRGQPSIQQPAVVRVLSSGQPSAAPVTNHTGPLQATVTPPGYTLAELPQANTAGVATSAGHPGPIPLVNGTQDEVSRGAVAVAMPAPGMATAEPSHPTATLVAQLAPNAPEHHAVTAATGQAQGQPSAQAHSLNAVVALVDHRGSDGMHATAEADHANALQGAVTAVHDAAAPLAVLTPGQSHGLTSHHSIGATGNLSQAQPVDQAVTQAFEQVQRALASGLRVVRVRLEPPSLGVIDVRLSESAGVLRISFATPHDAVRDALIRGLDDLRQSLVVHGFTVHRIEVAPSLTADTNGTPSGASSWNSWSDASSQRQHDASPWNTRASWQQRFPDESSQPLLPEPPTRDETPRTVDYWA